jgi:uncharacterized protein YggT (Ycf19 family)
MRCASSGPARGTLHALGPAVRSVTVDQLETYISALFTVFIIVIFIRILLSFLPVAPRSRWTRAIFDFVHQSTEWFLGFFRRIIPPLGMFDLSPIVALLVLYILRNLVLALLDSF